MLKSILIFACGFVLGVFFGIMLIALVLANK